MSFEDEFGDWLAYATVTVTPFTGPDAWGEGDYGDPVQVPAWYDYQERRVVTADGVTITTSTVLFAAPQWETALRPGAKVVIPGQPDEYKVMSLRSWPNDDDNHVEVTLL